MSLFASKFSNKHMYIFIFSLCFLFIQNTYSAAEQGIPQNKKEFIQWIHYESQRGNRYAQIALQQIQDGMSQDTDQITGLYIKNEQYYSVEPNFYEFSEGVFVFIENDKIYKGRYSTTGHVININFSDGKNKIFNFFLTKDTVMLCNESAFLTFIRPNADQEKKYHEARELFAQKEALEIEKAKIIDQVSSNINMKFISNEQLDAQYPKDFIELNDGIYIVTTRGSSVRQGKYSVGQLSSSIPQIGSLGQIDVTFDEGYETAKIYGLLRTSDGAIAIGDGHDLYILATNDQIKAIEASKALKAQKEAQEKARRAQAKQEAARKAAEASIHIEECVKEFTGSYENLEHALYPGYLQFYSTPQMAPVCGCLREKGYNSCGTANDIIFKRIADNIYKLAQKNEQAAIELIKKHYLDEYPEEQSYLPLGETLEKFFSKPSWEVTTDPPFMYVPSWTVEFNGIAKWGQNNARFTWIFKIDPKFTNNKISSYSFSYQAKVNGNVVSKKVLNDMLGTIYLN